jgi:alpha-glucosidase (family GH31 glycosyl hydrolase)
VSPPATGVNCYPLASAGPLHADPTRTFVVMSPRGFTPESLTILATLNGGARQVMWNVSTILPGNLNGTYSALDCYSTPTECYSESWGRMTPGLLSRAGVTLIDDSSSPRFVGAASSPAAGAPPPAPWWWAPAPSNYTDMYFLAYGNEYRGALAAVAAIAGPPALAPRAAMGVWWSRNFNYTAASFEEEILDGYASNGVPLHTAVLDMAW